MCLRGYTIHTERMPNCMEEVSSYIMRTQTMSTDHQLVNGNGVGQYQIDC